MEPLSPLSFNDPRDYLTALFAERKSRNHAYSVSAWAKNLGYRNSSLLSDVLKGRRTLTSKIRMQLAQNLKLQESEREYFDLICLMADAKSPHEQNLYRKRTQDLNPQLETTSLALDRFIAIKDWFHLTILEMVDLKGFKEDAREIAKRLGNEVTPQVVTTAIKRLLRLDLLQRDKSNKLLRKNVHLCIGGDIPDEAIREHHEQFIDKAKDALIEQSLQVRDFSGTTIALRREDFKKMQALIDRFHEDIHKIGGKSHADAVYRINVQMFQVTKEI